MSYMKTVVEFCPYYGCICITIQEEIKFSNVGKHDILWDVATLVDRVIQKKSRHTTKNLNQCLNTLGARKPWAVTAMNRRVI